MTIPPIPPINTTAPLAPPPVPAAESAASSSFGDAVTGALDNLAASHAHVDALAQQAATGDLTAHGVTNSVELSLEAQLLDDNTIAVVGTIPIKLSDFEISGLTGFAVLSVEDEAEVEFQLFFTR